MESVRKGAFSRFVVVLMSFHMLNLSIDPPDLHSHTIPEDLSINDIESVIELVIEDILGFDSFFAENDEADDNDYIVHNDFCFISNYDYTKSIKAIFREISSGVAYRQQQFISIKPEEALLPPEV